MAEQSERRGKVWGLVVAAVAEIPVNIIALVAVVEFVKHFPIFRNRTDVPFAIAVLVAQVIVVAAFTWGVLYLAFIRSRAPKRAVAYFFILTLVGLISNGGLIGLAVYASQHRAVFFKKQDDANARIALSEAAEAESFVAHHRVGSLTFHTGQVGEAERIHVAAKALVQDIAAADVTYSRKMRQLQFPDFLAPDRLDNDPNLEATLTRLDEVKTTILRHESETDNAIAHYRQEIAATNIDPGLKRAALDRIRNEMSQEKRVRAQQTLLQLSMVDEWRSVIIELRDERDRWHVDGEAISFSDVSAEQAYRQHMRSLLAKRRELIAIEEQ